MLQFAAHHPSNSLQELLLNHYYTASTPTYIYQFVIPCIIPAYSSVELQITRIPTINIHKQQSSFGTGQLDMAPTKRRFRKSAFYPLEIPTFQVPVSHCNLSSFLGFCLSKALIPHLGLWLFNDSLGISHPKHSTSVTSRYQSHTSPAIPCSNPHLTFLSLDGGLWFPSAQTRHEDRPWLWLSE